MDPPYGKRVRWDDTEDSAMAGIPEIAFLFTVDQVCGMLAWTAAQLSEHCFRMGIDPGAPLKRQLKLINISGDPSDPEWRIDWKEFRRYCRFHRIPVYRLT